MGFLIVLVEMALLLIGLCNGLGKFDYACYDCTTARTAASIYFGWKLSCVGFVPDEISQGNFFWVPSVLGSIELLLV
jgi:hypothetical protein